MGAPAADVHESYRRAGFALARWAGTHRGRALLVTSARAGEGTTTTLLQIAARLQREHGLRPVVVELPRARPDLTGRFGLNEEQTLEAALAGRRPAIECVQTTASGLAVIPAGMATGLASAGELQRVLTELDGYDLVLVDAPPVLGMADTIIAGSVVPNALLVVQAGRTRAEVLRRAQHELESVGVTIVATVLNRHRRFIPGWIYRWLIR
jgi:Mrp family chromosome partitioning ATPase